MPFLRTRVSKQRVVEDDELGQDLHSQRAVTDHDHPEDDPEVKTTSRKEASTSKRGGGGGGKWYASVQNSLRRVAGNNNHNNKQAVPQEPIAPVEPEEEEPPERQDEPVAPRRRIKKKKALLIDPSDQDDYDPVMAVFEARAQATQRVRFSVEPQVQGEEPKQEAAAEGSTSNKTPLPKDAPASSTSSSSSQAQSAANGIKKFMKNALFGKGNDESEAGLQKEIDAATQEVVWESATPPTSNISAEDLIRTRSGRVALSFTEDPTTRAKVHKLLNKARRAHCVHYRYEYAVKCHVKAMEYLKRANYPDDHPFVMKVAEALAHSHHALSSFRNSANIVKMGLKYEDTGDLVRALKMYTIAFRIRRDNLSRSHPSLLVLLNMLGSIQIKRGELEEAMEIYQLALKEEIAYENGSSRGSSATPASQQQQQLQDEIRPGPINLLARAVSYRELGTIYEQKNNAQKAIKMYEKSLECLADFKMEQMQRADTNGNSPSSLTLTATDSSFNSSTTREANSPTAVDLDAEVDDDPDASVSHPLEKMSTASGGEDGMEVLIQELAQHNQEEKATPSPKNVTELSKPECFALPTVRNYESFFPSQLDAVIQNRKRHRKSKPQKLSRQEKQAEHANIDAALTLHQIAQLHRSEGDFHKALSTYEVSLRGMKYCMGKNHPNVAAILGNIGNLQKEMNDLDSAFDTYQEVLGIESYRLGLSHPDVTITLHNIATIDAARGKHDHALALYGQVINLQRKLFGLDHASVAVTAACMADVYDRTGDMDSAVEWYEEAARIKTVVMGRHSLEVARLLHKLGKLASARLEYHLADSLVSRAILIYRLNKLSDDDEWMVDACRDAADSEAAIAMGKGVTFEC